MEHLSRSQFILLVLLVSFITSVATGIVTATLVSQAPPPITQTINRVIEKTVKSDNQNSSRGSVESLGSKKPIIITQEDLIVKLVKDVSPAVVSVIATKDLPVIEKYYINPFENDKFLKQIIPPELFPQFEIPQYRQKGTEKRRISSGTGFFISSDGLLLTNKHVVSDKEADYSIIMNDGRQLPAKVLARDPFQDIAVLKVEGKGFKFISLGDSDKLKVGQTVIAIGNALGEFQNTVSVGVVSGLHRSVVAVGSAGQSEQLQEVIQTDAAINPGNSGGPLLDLTGRVVGINTAVARMAENIGFALPINIAQKDIQDVKVFGRVKYAYLGVRYITITPKVQKERNLSVNYGALLVKGENGESAIAKGSPAERIGLKEGDIILEIDGKKITSKNTLAKIISKFRVGEKVILKVQRGKKVMNIWVTLDERPKNL